MKKKELKKLMFDCENGAPERRLEKCLDAETRLEQEKVRLNDRGRQQCDEYRRGLEAWRSVPVNGLPRPLALVQDVRDGRLFFAGAVILSAVEIFLAYYIALSFGGNPLFFVILALVAIFGLKAGVQLVWRKPTQPQLTWKRLLWCVLAPSLVITVLSIGMLIFARTASGMLALALLALLNWAVCLLSLGCLGLAAGFFAMSWLLFWSREAERRFNATEREAIETLRALRQVERIKKELQAVAPFVAPPTALTLAPGSVMAQSAAEAGPAAPASESVAGKLGRIAPLLLLSMLLLNGCQPPEKTVAGESAATPASGQAAQQAGEQTRVEIYLDWSQSTEARPFNEAVNSLITALPGISEQLRVERVTAFQFSSSGWAASEIVRADLPKVVQAESSEAAELFGQVKGAQQNKATQDYRAQLQESLSGLTAEKLLPPANAPEPRCTDLLGVLRRAAESNGPQRRVAIIITDGHDTCSRKLSPVTAGNPQTAIVVLLLPEHATTESGTLPATDYDQRSDEILSAVPNAVVIPYFKDITVAIGEALSKGVKAQKPSA